MKLHETLYHLAVTDLKDSEIPSSLFGAFRRKSISFFNGLTDEDTIVYWFQSKSFTIDVRLKHPTQTPIVERQGWIGSTTWDSDAGLLSWEVKDCGNYQNHIQWPEPAKLHAVGNSIFEFSPSNAYVEDWRQQAVAGLYLGLRLRSAVHVETQEAVDMDAAWIICDRHIAYAQSRPHHIQKKIQAFENLQAAVNAGIAESEINTFETSVSIDGESIQYSTQNSQIGQRFHCDGFELIDEQTLKQRREIDGELYELIFHVDTYVPHYAFQISTTTSAATQQWMQQEKSHLIHHAKVVY